MPQDQIVSVVRHNDGWAVVLTIPIGADDSITTLVQNHPPVLHPTTKRPASKRAAHINGVRLWTSLIANNPSRETFFASDDPQWAAQEFPQIAKSAREPHERINIAIKAFGLVRN